MILEIDNNIIKQRLLDLKSKKKCTRIQIASRCNMSKETVNSHFSKNGRAKEIEISTLYKYAQFFNVSLDYLITGKQEIKETSSKSFEECWAVEKADRILDAVRVLLEAYGTRGVTTEDRSGGGYDIYCTTFNIYDRLLMDYIDKAKPVVENKDLFIEHGLYEAAWENLRNKLWPNQSLVFNVSERELNGFQPLGDLEGFSTVISEEEGDLPF